MKRLRARDLGIKIGRFQPGKFNAITDVKGIKVGHSTIIKGRGPLSPGEGPVRTGVTCILPNDDVFMDRVVGGSFILNGAGEVSGITQVTEWGLIESPILLTNTLSVGVCNDSIVKYLINKHPGIGVDYDVVIPLVGECDDSWLNDVAGRHVKEEHVLEAVANARSGFVEEGSVGGGTGMHTCGFKSGIGSSSRRIIFEDQTYNLGVLVMSNFGHMDELRIDGVPVGKILAPHFGHIKKRMFNYGSIIAIVATDAPMLTHQLGRLAKRCALGIGRVGSHASHGSGEIIMAMSTGNTLSRVHKKVYSSFKAINDENLNPFYEAVIECTEESILNSIFASDSMYGVNDNFVPSLPINMVREVMESFSNLEKNFTDKFHPV
jgi:D-aminopeptidase